MRWVILLLGICGVASAAIFARVGLAAGVGAVELSAWRLIVAASAILLISAGLRRMRPMRRSHWGLLAVAGVFLAAHFATWIASLQTISVARSTLLVSTSPLWAGLAGLVVPSLRPRSNFWVGLALAAAGLLIFTVYGPPAGSSPSGPSGWQGDVLALVGAACIVPYLLISQRIQEASGTLTTVAWIYTAAAIALGLYMILAGNPSPPSTSEAWLAILGMAVFAQAIGHSALNGSLKHFSAAQVTTATLFEPVFAASLAWLVFGEPITWGQAAGGLVLLAGVWITLRPSAS